ncbi:hypothetical protein Q3H92_09090, partial [Curtobacterium flaccumfaciens]|nr:hypothetical protein [Curtobacterium flaccumfaciens]
MTTEPTDPTKRGPAVPPVPPPPPAVPRYEPKVSAPDEDLPGAPPVQREAPDRGVAESATLSGHPADPTHPRQPS